MIMSYHFHTKVPRLQGLGKGVSMQRLLSGIPGLRTILALAALSALGITTPVTGQGRGAHQHGVARMQVAVEEDAVLLRFESPLDSLVGFETAPRSEKQRQAVRRMAARLHRPQDFFVPTAQAQCAAVGVALVSEVIAPELLAAPAGSGETVAHPGNTGDGGKSKDAARGHAAKAGGGGTAHADLAATISFRCAKPQSLSGLQVKLFDAFPDLRQIDVEIVTTKGQSGARLSPNRAGLSW